MNEPTITQQLKAEEVGDTPPKSSRQRTSPGRPRKDAAPKTAPSGRGRPPSGGRPKLAPKLQEMFGAVGTGVMVAGIARDAPRLSYDGQIILANAERLANALEAAANENPAIRRTLELLLTATAYGELMGAALAVAVPILANHGVIPGMAAVMFGAPEPPEPAPDDEPEEPPPPFAGAVVFANGAGNGA